MANDLDKEKKWAEHMPSEGENPRNVDKQTSRGGVEEKVSSPEARDAMSAAPAQGDPRAAQHNREFVEDTAMEYNDKEEKAARKGD